MILRIVYIDGIPSTKVYYDTPTLSYKFNNFNKDSIDSQSNSCQITKNTNIAILCHLFDIYAKSSIIAVPVPRLATYTSDVM